MQDCIEIRRATKSNVLTTALFGLLSLFVASQILIWLPNTWALLGILLVSLSLVALLVAYYKYREPTHSFLLSRQTIQYRHKHGQWKIDWHNVQRIDVPRISHGLSQQDLSMVGIKLKSYGPFLSSISPRLMTNILMEQRPLLLYDFGIADAQCATGKCYSDDLLEDDRFKDSDGTIYKGIQAMLANRMQKLRQRLGYDVFVASSELDRSEHAFVDLLKQCQQQLIMESR
jgi:hypothetical protein